MIAAFEGWNDAGSSASAAVDHLARVWGATEYRTLDAEDYHDFQVSRPTISRNERGERVVSWPGTVISTAEVPSQPGRTLLLARGIEPSMRWRQFCDEVLDAAEERGVTVARDAAARYSSTPRTRARSRSTSRPRRRTCASSSTSSAPTTTAPRASRGCLATRPRSGGFRSSPGGSAFLTTSRTRRARRRRAPFSGPWSASSGAPIDLGDLEYEAEAWERGVDELAEEDEESRRSREGARGGDGRREPARGLGGRDRGGVRAVLAPPRGRRRPVGRRSTPSAPSAPGSCW